MKLTTAAYPESLVVYRSRPARVCRVGKSLEIELPGGERLNVRTKDVTVIHPGPLSSLAELTPQTGEIETAWELLAGSRTNLAELAELAFGEYSPATAWAAWQLVADGLHFRGTPTEVIARSADEVEREQQVRQQKLDEERGWRDFLDRARAGRPSAQDQRYVSEVEDLALGRKARSRVLRELKRAETPESAHALLLEWGVWDPQVDPYPQRLGVSTIPVELDVPSLPAEPRLDLTHLPALAIDDEGNQDPDDALSLEGQRLWVHVADVAALVPPNCAMDSEACARAATLYLPEGSVPMLPRRAIQVLGLGLSELSPALSFGLDLGSSGEVLNLHIAPSWIRVTRLTYDQAEAMLDREPLARLRAITQSHEQRRRQQGAIRIDLPEVRLRVQDGQVLIQPLPALQSRDLVSEAMLMAGATVARFGLERGLALPFSTQDPPASEERPTDIAGMYALRQALRPSAQSTVAGLHAGLGLMPYAQVTSPLRRYLDLVVHQQLRAHLRSEPPLSQQEVLQRIGAALPAAASIRQAERLARRHWTLVFLLQHPDWHGEGILVERRHRRGTLLVPSLDLDCQVHLRHDAGLNSRLRLSRPEVDLPHLDVRFEVEPRGCESNQSPG